MSVSRIMLYGIGLLIMMMIGLPMWLMFSSFSSVFVVVGFVVFLTAVLWLSQKMVRKFVKL